MTHVILHTDAPGPAVQIAQDQHPDLRFTGCDSYPPSTDVISVLCGKVEVV